MNCPIRNSEPAELLLDYCARQLPPAAEVEVEAHLQLCPECRAFTEAQKRVWTELENWEAPLVSAEFDRKLYERIGTIEQQSWRQWLADKVRLRPALSIGAACSALVLALLVRAPTTNSPVGNQPAPPAVIQENSRVESLMETDQLERALDDLEMLRQLSPSSAQNL